jgi:hypothetical protein
MSAASRNFGHKYNIEESLPKSTQRMHIKAMKTSIEIDSELAEEIKDTVFLVREKPATIIRMAIRAGLPLVAGRFRASRPEGYFANDYPLPKDRLALEAGMSRSGQAPDR